MNTRSKVSWMKHQRPTKDGRIACDDGPTKLTPSGCVNFFEPRQFFGYVSFNGLRGDAALRILKRVPNMYNDIEPF